MWSIIDRVTRTGSRKVGNHRFILDGAVVIGPQFHYVIGVILLSFIAEFIVLKSVLYFDISVGIIFIVLSTIHLGLLLGVALTDPGIVPPNPSGSMNPNSASKLTSIVNGTKVDQKWCHACNVYMPPRGKHCQICGSCVDRHDHHCKFLSNCIGARNYRTFVLFLISSFVPLAFVAITILGRPSSTRTLTTWLIFVCCAVMLVITANLIRYHGALVLRGSTSYEQYRGFAIDDEESQVEANPFSLGTWRANLSAFLTTPTDPTRVTFTPLNPRRGTEEEMVAVLDASPVA